MTIIEVDNLLNGVVIIREIKKIFYGLLNYHGIIITCGN